MASANMQKNRDLVCGDFVLPFSKKLNGWVLPENYQGHPGQPLGERIIKNQSEAYQFAMNGGALMRRFG